MVGSDIIKLEASKNPDVIKRRKVLRLHDGAVIKTKYNEEIKSRAKQFRGYGFGLFDSMHVASAEYAMVNVFLTVDNQLLNASARSDVTICVENPLNFYTEVLKNE